MLKVNHLEETVYQQWTFINQLTQRVDKQDQMLNKSHTNHDETKPLQSNNNTFIPSVFSYSSKSI